MACATAVNQPVHVVDIDRKIGSAGWAKTLIEAGQLTYWELSEALDEENMRSRMSQLYENKRPSKQPLGLSRFAEYMYALPGTEEGKRAGTWVIDSATILNDHVTTHLSHLAGHSKFEFDNWAALSKWWVSSTSTMRDLAKENGKDLIFTVHEREGEKAGDKTSGVRYETDLKGNRQRIRQGTMDLKIWASISGGFGELFGAVADEYYWLYVDMDAEKNPVWKCRIHPDGIRSLRTSFMHSKAVHEPDFRKIWK